jgi:hypothetical protein
MYVYDLGDQYRHTIELIEIKDKGFCAAKNVTIVSGKARGVVLTPLRWTNRMTPDPHAAGSVSA